MLLHFFCPGEPIAQGSKRHVGKGVMIESSAKLRPWREAVAFAAETEMNATGTRFLTGSVAVVCTFYFTRPLNHFGTGRNAEIIKPTAPFFKTSRPDIDKLVRSLLDSLVIAGVLRDDAQVGFVRAEKRYGPRAGVECKVSALERKPEAA